ncbi:MAG: InlB B-repeat-containing protein [Clostridiales bacterium]|nr:InlB B-repeat-containing protein [Clostridiales bacterium]
MDKFKKWVYRSLIISLLCIIISCLLGAFATVSYADEQITPEDQSGTQLEKFTVLFNLGDDVEGEAPESMEVEPETSITLPDAEQFSKEGYTFAGWNDGLDTYSPGDSYTVNSNVVFTAQWEKNPEKRITGYNKFTGIVLSGDEYIYDLDLLKGSGKLPEKAELVYEYGEESTVEVDIKGWQGEFDGSMTGTYALTAIWEVPEGYILDEEGLTVTINVVVETPQTNPETVTIDYEPGNEFIVNGTDENDVIKIVSLDGGIIQITIITDGEVTHIYELSNKKKIVIDGKDGDDTIYLDLSGKSAGLTDLVILGGKGKDTVTRSDNAGTDLDLGNVDILIKAEKVLFESQQELKFKAENLTINAAPTESSKFYEAQNIKVVFRNVDFEITGDFKVDATTYISNGQEVEDGENGQGAKAVYEIDIQDESSTSENIVETALEEVIDGIDDTLKTVVNAATVSVEVELDTAKVSASNVSIKTTNDIEMKTGSGVVPLTVTVADLISNITIKGSSLINSANDILLSAYANIQATADASSNIPIPLSVAVMVLTSHVGLSVTDTSRLTAGKDITLEAVNNIDTKNLSNRGQSRQSGGFNAVTAANQNTKAALEGEASAQASNLTIRSQQTNKTQTYADNVSGEEEDGDEGDGSGENGQGFSFKDILTIISSIKSPTDQNKPLIKAETTDEIENSFNHVSEGFAYDEGQGFAGRFSFGAPAQLVGAVGVAVVNSNNEASIKTTALIDIAEKISVLAEALTKNIVIADASAIDENYAGYNPGMPFGLGVGVAVGLVNHKNYSFVEGSDLKANAIQVKAYTLDNDNQEKGNLLTVGSKAGFNEAAFGLGGAVSIGIYSGENKAYIGDNTKIELTGNTDTSLISIESRDISETEIVADASSQDQGDAWNWVYNAKRQLGKPVPQDGQGIIKTGIGSGVAVSIFDNDVTARMGKVTISGIVVKDLKVEADSRGSNDTSAAAGEAGGICIVPVVAVNTVNNRVKAIMEAFHNNPVKASGTVMVSASGNRTTLTEANAEAGGAKVAVGAAVAIGIIDMLEEAVLDRSIGTSSQRPGSVSVTAIGVNSNEVTAYAGENGGKNDSDDSGQGSAGSITNLFGRTTGVISSLRGSRDLAQTGTVNTAGEQKAETPEGILTFAASVALTVVNSETISVIGKESPVKIYTGNLSIITRTNKDAVANANASAVNGSPYQEDSKVGIGAAAAIINIRTVNNAVLGKNRKCTQQGMWR